MLTAADAERFAASWYAAWNAHDLDGIMGHYAEAIEHSSPFIARYNGDAACRPLHGKAAVRAYFGRALERNPALRFDPLHVAVGVASVALAYRRMTGELALEAFELDGAGLVVRSTSHYGVERSESVAFPADQLDGLVVTTQPSSVTTSVASVCATMPPDASDSAG
jgi:hypothetical protein